MPAEQSEIHLDDLARPRLPFAIRAFNALAGPLMRWQVDLAPGALLALAKKREGLDDFGPGTFREGLEVLCKGLDAEARLSAAGRFMVRELVVQLLSSRLRLEALIQAHPEILQERVDAPLVVVGLPRTGTSALHSLLSQHPALRSLPYWESLEPFPGPKDREQDRRLERCEQATKAIDWFMPYLRAMHEITPTSPHEEIQLLAMDFRTMLFEVSYQIPSYAAWYRTQDLSPSFLYLRRVLQALQWLRGPKRWVLKSPQHLEQLPALLSAFPDARIVQTHRDPVEVVCSMATMISYGNRMNGSRVDPPAIGRYWAQRIQDMLRANVEHRSRLSAASFLDVRFEELVADNVGTAEKAFAFAGLPFDAPARAAVSQHALDWPRHAFGKIAYRLEDVGLDAAALRPQFRFYADRFSIAA
ncbi:MAG: sulfotransferase [Myxococcales bacterium]